jgi:hypothetical protein
VRTAHIVRVLSAARPAEDAHATDLGHARNARQNDDHFMLGILIIVFVKK